MRTIGATLVTMSGMLATGAALAFGTHAYWQAAALCVLCALVHAAGRYIWEWEE